MYNKQSYFTKLVIENYNVPNDHRAREKLSL